MSSKKICNDIAAQIGKPLTECGQVISGSARLGIHLQVKTAGDYNTNGEETAMDKLS